MESGWSGAVDGAFFDPVVFDKHRVLQLAETEFNGRNSDKAYYVLGIDVGRIGCTTEVVVCKVSPSQTGVPVKNIVNLYSYEEEHFAAQAIKIKRIFKQFNCNIAVVDANGLGVGLVDELVRDTEDPDTGEFLPNLGVYNDDPDKPVYKRFENENTIHNALYLMKANVAINTELYAYAQAQMRSGKVRFLIDENIAKNKLMSQAQSKRMSRNKRSEYLQPFVMTSILRDQMLNLVQENEGANIILKQQTRTIKKDKFSAFIYALWWSKIQEESKKKKKFDASKMMLFSKH